MIYMCPHVQDFSGNQTFVSEVSNGYSKDLCYRLQKLCALNLDSRISYKMRAK